MALEFIQTGGEDRGEIQALLRQAFRLDDGAPLLDARLTDWKYWKPRPDWNGSRSYVLRRDGRIESHAAILPLVLAGGPVPLSALHFIDWAAVQLSVSAGAKLLQRLTGLCDLTLAIGGAQSTRRLLPMLKFRPAGTVRTMVRPIRPWLQMRTHQARNWKLPARLVRNALWNWRAPLHSPGGWEYRRVLPHEVPDPLWTAAGEPGSLWRRRRPEIASYYLSCPDVRFDLFLGCENGRPQGCFLLGLVPGVANITDLWVIDPNRDRYERMYRLAAAAAHRAGTIAEVAAYASTPERTAAMERCGFRALLANDLMVYSRTEIPSGTIDCQMIDNDAAFLHEVRPAYLS